MKLKLGSLICILAALYLSPSSNAETKIYKWVDENGKVHYSDKPIEEDSEEVKLEEGPTADEQAAARKQAQKLINLQNRRVGNQLEQEYEKKQTRITQEQDAQKLAANCAYARQQQRVLEYQAPVYQENDKGERVFFSDEARAKELKELKALIEKHCSGN